MRRERIEWKQELQKLLGLPFHLLSFFATQLLLYLLFAVLELSPLNNSLYNNTRKHRFTWILLLIIISSSPEIHIHHNHNLIRMFSPTGLVPKSTIQGTKDETIEHDGWTPTLFPISKKGNETSSSRIITSWPSWTRWLTWNARWTWITVWLFPRWLLHLIQYMFDCCNNNYSSLSDISLILVLVYWPIEPPTGDYPFASGPGGPDGPGGPFVPGYTDFGPGSGPDYSPDSRPFFGYPGHLDGFNGPPPPPNHGPPPPGQPLGPNTMSL